MAKRYKIQKHFWVSSREQEDKIHTTYYILYEKKLWWKKEPIWKHCTEHDWDCGSCKVSRGTVDAAEKYIKVKMKEDEGFEPEDIKIYECRDSKLEKILKK